MRWVRSWPSVVPAGRSYVVDSLPRLVIAEYDYAPLGALDDDLCLLEWDMALSPEDMQRFAADAQEQPDCISVAPYRLYTIGTPEPVYVHRALYASGPAWVSEGQPVCDYFGFGCIYFPRDLVRAFLAAPAPARGRPPELLPAQAYADCRMHDQTFSIWHRHVMKRQVDINWGVRPVHLHW